LTGLPIVRRLIAVMAGTSQDKPVMTRFEGRPRILPCSQFLAANSEHNKSPIISCFYQKYALLSSIFQKWSAGPAGLGPLLFDFNDVLIARAAASADFASIPSRNH
jgi:hypothetical protein